MARFFLTDLPSDAARRLNSSWPIQVTIIHNRLWIKVIPLVTTEQHFVDAKFQVQNAAMVRGPGMGMSAGMDEQGTHEQDIALMGKNRPGGCVVHAHVFARSMRARGSGVIASCGYAKVQ
jgi:hypothetical protein